MTVCSICGDHYYGWGHNANPVNNGRCCEGCNWMEVIPARMRQMRTLAPISADLEARIAKTLRVKPKEAK